MYYSLQETNTAGPGESLTAFYSKAAEDLLKRQHGKSRK